MSQMETNRLATSIATPRLNGHGTETSARAFSVGPAVEVVVQSDGGEIEELCAEFLAGLSRNMRTPLSSILGVIQMMLETQLSETHKEFADTIADSVHSLAAMADSFADFSRRLASHHEGLRAPALPSNEKGSAAA